MARPRRRDRARASTPEALAAALPDELRAFDNYADPVDLRAHIAAVTDWLRLQGRGQEATVPVMDAAGISVANWYHQALNRNTT